MVEFELIMVHCPLRFYMVCVENKKKALDFAEIVWMILIQRLWSKRGLALSRDTDNTPVITQTEGEPSLDVCPTNIREPSSPLTN